MLVSQKGFHISWNKIHSTLRKSEGGVDCCDTRDPYSRYCLTSRASKLHNAPDNGSYPFLGLQSSPEEVDRHVLRNVVASLAEKMYYAQNISHFHGFTELHALL